MNRFARLAIAIAFALALAALPCAAADNHTLYQKPIVSRTHIVFVYAGDLWRVPRTGGDAERLTTGTGTETDPRFSPDGAWVAFTGEYDGNVDVYIVAADGGVPKRLTWHPGADSVAGWSPDGKSVMFRSTRDSFAGFNRLYTMPVDGGFPTAVPLPMGFEGAFSADAKRIAYQPVTQWQPAWKRYRGGQTAKIWIAALADSSTQAVPRENSNDSSPMWIGDDVYFLSDREGSVTLYAYNTGNKKVTRVLANEALDIKWASAGPDAIAFERFGTIHLLDLKTRKSQQVKINLTGDLASVRPRFERAAARMINPQISPTGARAVFEVRGEIVTVPAEKGDPRNLTNTPGVMERFPAWSPDGKSVAYFSDESGEYALHIRAQNGMGEARKISLGPSFFFNPVWSPDSKKIAYTDKKLNIWYVELDKGTPVRVDTNPYGLFAPQLLPVWSPDSRWIAYTRQLENRLPAVFVYSVEAGKATQLTDGMSDARYVAFDKKGEHLYFTASTDAGPTLTAGDMSQIAYRSTRSVYLIVLRKDLPSPLAPESDEEKVADEKKAEAKPDEKPAAAADAQKPGAPPKEAPPVKIDLDDIDQRVVALAIPARDYQGLYAGKAGTIFLLENVPPPATAPPGAPAGLTLHKYTIEQKKLERVLENITSFRISRNGEKLLYRTGPQWMIISATQPPRPGEGALRTDGVEVRVDPAAEWAQMYREAWRHEREFFYDPGLHGVNLKTTEKYYQPYLAAVAHRSDLNYLFTEMLNQLSVGHMFIGGGDVPQPNRVTGGLLGADYSIENGRYRFARVYYGENWNPQLRAPLTQPGVNVKAGEYLLAVNGKEVRGTGNIYSFFESTANKSVILRVGADPSGANARDVTVVPVATESALRNRAWVDDNRRKVDQLSGGKLAYIYLPDTGGGGLLAEYVISYLTKPLFNYIANRDGADFPTPAGAIHGPKAMLINESAGSGGDAMPWYFRKAAVGPLIGKRTWGGLVGVGGTPQLMDGGFVAAPSSGLYGLKGDWEVENVGVPPDIEVEYDPKAWRAGRDPQLDKAVEVLLDELKKKPSEKPKRPQFPNFHRATVFGATPERAGTAPDKP